MGLRGICLGDIASNLLCQVVRSRKWVLLVFLLAAFALSNLYFFLDHPTPGLVYGVAFALGIAVGYWSIFVTIAAEHFGTNMRATAATTVSNFVRAPSSRSRRSTPSLKPHFGALHTAWDLAGSPSRSPSSAGSACGRTFTDDLDYLEK